MQPHTFRVRNGILTALSLAALLLCPPAARGQSAPSFIQAPVPVTCTANSFSCSSSFVSGNTLGSTNLVMIRGLSPAQTNQVTDTNGNSYTLIGVALTTTAANNPAVIGSLYAATSVVAGADTISFTFNAANGAPGLQIAEYSGPSSIYGLSTILGSITALAGAPITAAANTRLVTFGVLNNAATVTAGGSNTLRQATNAGFFIEDQLIAGQGVYSPTATASINTDSASFEFAMQTPAATQTQVTGTLKDLSGALVTSGQVNFTLAPGLQTTIGGNSQFTPITVSCSLSASGQIQNLTLTGPCLATQNTSLTPAGTAYRVQVCPYGSCGPAFYTYLITPTVNLSLMTPTPFNSAIYSLVDTFSNQTIGGNKTFTGVTSLPGGVAGSVTFANGVTVNGLFVANAGGTLAGSFISTGLTFLNSLCFASGTNFSGCFQHADTVNRTYTMPDANGTVCLTTTCAPIGYKVENSNTTPVTVVNNGTLQPLMTFTLGAGEITTTGEILRVHGSGTVANTSGAGQNYILQISVAGTTLVSSAYAIANTQTHNFKVDVNVVFSAAGAGGTAVVDATFTDYFPTAANGFTNTAVNAALAFNTTAGQAITFQVNLQAANANYSATQNSAFTERLN